MKLFARTLICSLLVSTAGFSADDKPVIRIVAPDPDHTCATHFVGIYEQLEKFKGRAVDVGIGNLSRIEALLKQSGLPAEQAKFYADSIKTIAFGATDAVDVLGQVLAFLRNVWSDEGLFGVSVPKREPIRDIAPFTSHYAVNAPFKYVGKFAAAPAYSEVPKRPEYPQYDETTFWNGLIFYPLAFDQAPDQATAYVTTVSKFYNMSAQLHAEFMLGHMSRYVQRGGKAHAELKDFIFADGKEIDYGFARLFAEARGAAAEIQAAQYALKLINVPDREIQRWAEHHSPIIVKQALERLGKAPVQAQPILDKLGITETTFMTDWKRLTEWVEHRGEIAMRFHISFICTLSLMLAVPTFARQNLCVVMLEVLSETRGLYPFLTVAQSNLLRDQLLGKYPALRTLNRWVTAGENPFSKKAFLNDLEKLDEASVAALLTSFKSWGYTLRYSHEMEQAIKAAPTEKRLKALLLDPSIGCRAKDFLAWTKAEGLTDKPFHEIRARYAAHLGDVTVYRGLVLTADQAQSMKENGIDPPANFVGAHPLPLLLAQGPVGGIAVKYQLGQNSLYHSVSENEDVAGAAGNWNRYSAESKLAPAANAKVYVFQLKLPRLDTVTRNNLGVVRGEGDTDPFSDVYLREAKNFQQIWGLYLLGTPPEDAFIGPGTLVGPRMAPNVEAFIFGKITPAQIVSYSEYTKPLVVEQRRNFDRPVTTYDSKRP